MDQLSLPYRIALVAILVVGALYLVVLKPAGGDEAAIAPLPAPAAATTTTATKTSKPSAPGVAGLSSAVTKARGASAAQAGSDATTSTAADAASETTTTTTTAPVPGAPVAIAPAAGATTATTPAAATTTTAKPTVKPSTDPSAPLLAELDRGRTVVLLFAGRTAADDRAVRRALGRIDRRGGKVAVHVAALRRVGAYEAITRGVQVQQSPTLLVIGKDRTARTIVGFTTTSEIDQLVGDVRRG